MTDQHDRMVGEYLDAVRRATVDLPPDRRDDLLADLSEHIATARAELDPETEAGVLTPWRLPSPPGRSVPRP